MVEIQLSGVLPIYCQKSKSSVEDESELISYLLLLAADDGDALSGLLVLFTLGLLVLVVVLGFEALCLRILLDDMVSSRMFLFRLFIICDRELTRWFVSNCFLMSFMRFSIDFSACSPLRNSSAGAEPNLSRIFWLYNWDRLSMLMWDIWLRLPVAVFDGKNESSKTYYY